MVVGSERIEALNVEQKTGFFNRLLGGDPIKRKANRVLKKDLNSVRMGLYKLKQDIILPPIAKIIYEIYKFTYPMRQILPLDKATNRFPPSFEESFILQFHQDSAREIYNKLNEDYINKLALKNGIKKTTIYIEKLLNEYFESFDRERILKINSLFTNFLYFTRFVYFDFYPILREFDSYLEEANFIKKPSFSGAEGSLLRGDLYKLHRALATFEADDKLDQGIDIYGTIKNFKPISQTHLERLKQLIYLLQKNNYLSLIIRCIDKKIDPLPKEKRPYMDVFTSFSLRTKGNIYTILNAVKNRIKEGVVSSLVNQLFDGNVEMRVKNYNETKNEPFKSLGLTLFEYTSPLNYEKAFLTDKYKSSIGKIINELIINGIFIDKGALNELSNSYYVLNNLLEEINQFEDDLDIDGDSGKVIKRHVSSLKSNESSRKVLEKTIHDINSRAKLIIDEGILNMKQLAYGIKNTLEDYKKKTPAIITNIRKIRASNNRQFIEEILNSYREIYLFLKLISNYVALKVLKPVSGEEKRNNSDERG